MLDINLSLAWGTYSALNAWCGGESSLQGDVPEVPHDGPSTSWFWVFKLSKRGERSIVRHVDARHDGKEAEIGGS